MLRKMYIALANVILWINFLLIGHYGGFLQGYAMRSLELPQDDRFLSGGLWYTIFSNGSIYNVFYANHVFLILPLVFMIIGKLIKKESRSQAICLISLIAATVIYWRTYFVKMDYINQLGSDGPVWYSEAARNVLPLDKICLILLALLLIYQIFLFFQHCRRRK